MRYKTYRIGSLFVSQNGDTDIQKRNISGSGIPVITSGVENFGILGLTDICAKVIKPNTLTIDMFGNVFFRPFEYKMVTHARVFSMEPIGFEMTERIGLYFVTCFSWLSKKYNYSDMCSFAKIKDLEIILPSLDELDINSPYSDNGYIIDFNYIQQTITKYEQERIAELEQEKLMLSKRYLTATGLDNFNITDLDKEILAKPVSYEKFNVEKLFGKSTRGKRLKSRDRIKGNLPFVTAGEANEGISAFIGNDVKVFKPNTSTIDMFGSAKYRGYEYGGDDHVAIVHTEDLSEDAAMYVTTALHKAAHTCLFSYMNNFYAKDADALNIVLPILVNNDGIAVRDEKKQYHELGYIPDWDYMSKYNQVIKKLVISDKIKSKDNLISMIKVNSLS